MSHCQDSLDEIFNCDGDDCNDDCIDDACDDGVICINDKCYTCPNDAGIYLNDNGTCACTDGSACVEAPLKDSRDAIETTDALDDLNCDGDDDGDGVICINGVCYTCANGAGIYFNNRTCACTDGSACVEASPATQAAELSFDIED